MLWSGVARGFCKASGKSTANLVTCLQTCSRAAASGQQQHAHAVKGCQAPCFRLGQASALAAHRPASLRASQSCARHSVATADAGPETQQQDDSRLPAASAAQEPGQLLDSGLYLVGTPIGNLEDITLRAIRVLRLVDTILCEDTRHSRKLLSHLGINTSLVSFHAHNEGAKQQQVLERLAAGAALALISDAGMPAISDPGADLVAAAVSAGHRVIPIPGPSAVLAALVASGLPTTEFLFAGFLPPKTGARQKRLQQLAGSSATLVLYAPPHSLAAMLADAVAVLGAERRCVVARELTKLHEEFFRDTLQGAHQEFTHRTPKGEVTVVIEGTISVPEQLSADDVEQVIKDHMLKGQSPSRAAKHAAELYGVPRRQAYDIALKLADAMSPPEQ